jgi:hypothetical protein
MYVDFTSQIVGQRGSQQYLIYIKFIIFNKYIFNVMSSLSMIVEAPLTFLPHEIHF